MILCFVLHVQAQTMKDSTADAIGVITVKRPGRKAYYLATMNYFYPVEMKQGSKKKAEMVVGQPGADRSGENSPYPFFIYPNRRPAGDTANGEKFVRSHSAPPEPFDWNTYLSGSDFSFGWEDSLTLDSALFIFTINENGRATCRPDFYNGIDSTGKRLTYALTPAMHLQWLWYPANRMAGDNEKHPERRYMACTVEVKVYACPTKIPGERSEILRGR